MLRELKEERHDQFFSHKEDHLRVISVVNSAVEAYVFPWKIGRIGDGGRQQKWFWIRIMIKIKGNVWILRVLMVVI